MKSTYNTRRKSVSLTALGVQLPGRSRASTESKPDTTSADSHSKDSDAASSPPSKRVKTSHSPSSPPRGSPTRRPSTSGSRPRKSSSPTALVTAAPAEQSRPKSRHLEYTPPPSPGAATESKIDYDTINDDIVAGVVTQLEKTGNRPHLIKELAAVLSTTHDSVTSSANAPALLSSRLASFMKRSCWNSSNTCPVGKELIPVHPRKVFYYLTDRPRQELPETSEDIYGPLGITSPTQPAPPAATSTSAGVGIMGPPSQLPAKRLLEPALSKFQNDSPPLSIASAAGDDDSTTNADERRERWAPSPSPEVDLTIHDTHSEYGDDGNNNSSSSTNASNNGGDKVKREHGAHPVEQAQNGASRNHVVKQELEPPRQLHLNTRAQSPRVEGDEREFRDTVFSLRASPTEAKAPPTPTVNKMDGVVTEEDERETRKVPEYDMNAYSGTATSHAVSSPAFPAHSTAVFTPKQAPTHMSKVSNISDVSMADDDLGCGIYGWDLNAPEDIDVDELDGLLEGC